MRSKIITLLKNNLERIIFLINAGLYLLLLLRNPFSERTLIPNFDPFPDATYYLAPPLNLLKGFGLNMYREGRYLIPGVAPLYSIILLPIFLIKADPRMFYFINVLLSLVSYYLYYLIIKKIIKMGKSTPPLSSYLLCLFFSLCLFPLNFYLYWYPQWAMAENLLLPLFLLGIYLLVSKINSQNAVLAGIVSLAFVATKYANFPLTLIFPVLYLAKLATSPKNRSVLLKFLTALFLALLLFIGHDRLFKNRYFIKTLFGEVKPIVNQTKEAVVSPAKNSAQLYQGSWFSIYRISIQTKNYLNSLFGAPSRILWENTPLLTKYLCLLAWLGLIVGLLTKQYRFLSLSLLLLLFGQIIFLSTYNTFDYRYAYFAIPTLFLGLAILFGFLLSIPAGLFQTGVRLLVTALLIIYFSGNFLRLKQQIGLNLKYAEVPWYYLAVKKLNTDFPILKKPKPIVISSMLPYYLDFYSNGNYELLPLDKTQDLFWCVETVWGVNNYDSLIKLYQQKITEGRSVYLFSYYKGNRFNDYTIRNNFELQLISRGCLDTCNLYQLKKRAGDH